MLGRASSPFSPWATFDRKTRKDAFYFYKANWSQSPVLHITSRRFTARTAPTTEVKIYSNASEVELLLNGKSLGKKPVGSDRIVRWPGVTLVPGENKLRVTAQHGGQALADECAWTLRPAAKTN